MHPRHERCRRHVSQKVMIAIVSFGLMLSSCATLHKTPTPFETAYKTYITTFDAWHEDWVLYKDHKRLWLNSDDISKASDSLINVAKEAKPYASDALKNAINDAFDCYEIRFKANEDNLDKMRHALANAYKGVLIDDKNYLFALETYFKALEIFRNTPVPDKDVTSYPSRDAYDNATSNLLKAAAKNVPTYKASGYYYPDFDIYSGDTITYYDSYLRDAIILSGNICNSAHRADSIAFKKAVEDAVKVFEAAEPNKQVSSIP
ncbi:hypothetical protein AGMMS49990_05920 [Endomicrobiia bacterium]|nr:hypothetical protein AGMMS49990_05920 [Endomicrobiia bacterium]